MKKSSIYNGIAAALVAAGWLMFDRWGIWLLAAAAVTSTAAMVSMRKGN